jgi:hypothetical protein
MTWREMVKLEPRLGALLREAQKVDGSDPHFCANDVWYGYEGGCYAGRGLKRQLCQLVGWYARRPELRGCDCYDVAYMKIYDALPPCRDCLCL